MSAGPARATIQQQIAPPQRNGWSKLKVWGRAPYAGTASFTTAFLIHTEEQPQAWWPNCGTSSTVQDCIPNQIFHSISA